MMLTVRCYLTFLLINMLIALLPDHSNLYARDTLRVSLQEFVSKGLENSRLLQAERQNIDLAENQLARARGTRILPDIRIQTAHGLIPGVYTSQPDLFGEGELYLDPDLRNDWRDWGIFTQAELSAVQPLFTWGAINNAIHAAQAGANAARHEFNVGRSEYEMQLVELYYARLLTIELERLLQEAAGQMERAQRILDEMLEEGDPDLEEAEVFKFNIFRYEFDSQAEEVMQNLSFVEATWRLALNAGRQQVYLPEEHFLDPVPAEIREINYYLSHALNNRPEIKGLEAAAEAADFGLKATRAQYLPGLFLGMQGSLAHTPNRPRQTNPFIINTTNYASGAFGIGIRQNLNFSGYRRDVERSQAQIRQAKYFKDAAVDGITLELNEQYRDVRIAEARVSNTRQMLNVSNQWLRQEQIDYDLGFTDMENLVDAVKTNLELDVSYRQRIHDFNIAVARLHYASGLPLVN